MEEFIAYYRVSTAKQGKSGLGIAAQKHAVEEFLRQRRGAKLLKEFTEHESGKTADRPKLQQAMSYVQATRGTLLIAKLDRLSRDAAFLLGLRSSGVNVVCADLPQLDSFSFGVLALVAQYEREMIAERTRKALEQAKKRGTRLGNPNGAAALRRANKGNRAALEAIEERANADAFKLLPILQDIQAAEGVTSLAGIAQAFNDRSIKTPRGGKWHASSVRNLQERLRAA